MEALTQQHQQAYAEVPGRLGVRLIKVRVFTTGSKTAFGLQLHNRASTWNRAGELVLGTTQLS